ncbi:hypothetical protein [Francisella salimarina]|uniref:hypothetical protein n=1 Tax=Francisella salimarina TaxID=2599927 RepID=UPI0037529168
MPKRKVISFFTLFIFCLSYIYANVDQYQQKMVYFGYGSLIKNSDGLHIGPWQANGPDMAVDFLRVSGLYFAPPTSSSACIKQEDGTCKKMTVPLPAAMCLSVNDEDGKSTGYLLANQVRLAVTFIPQDLITLDAKRTAMHYAVVDNDINFDQAREELAKREGTSTIENIAYIKRENQDYNKFELSTKAKSLNEQDINEIKNWMDNQGVDVVFFAYFDANFTEQMQALSNALIDKIDVSEWNSENVHGFYDMLRYYNWGALGTANNYIVTTPENTQHASKFWINSQNNLLTYTKDLLNSGINPKEFSHWHIDCSQFIANNL